EDAYKFTTW
nr:RecName: Full=60 kDa cell wall protein [Phaseolus vulgaris]